MVEDESIFRLAQESAAGELPEKLVSLANQNGGQDNVTVVTIAS